MSENANPSEATEVKKEPGMPVPIDKRLHKLLKQRALDRDTTIRGAAEEILGKELGWQPEPESAPAAVA